MLKSFFYIKKNKILFFLSIILFFSCHSIDEQINGCWTIEEFDAESQIRTNGFCLNQNKTCLLPWCFSPNDNPENEIGNWQTIEKNGKYFLQIKTSNTLFNKTFEIVNLRKDIDSATGGSLMKMTLISDSVKIKCITGTL